MQRISALLLGIVLAQSSLAQVLPAPSRTVFKCEFDGKVHYSDAPCLGAKRVDVEPTRGMDRSSGKPQVGSDVLRERTREGIGEAMKPITGQSTEQLYRNGRRSKLSVAAQQECRRLDSDIPAAERREAVEREPAELRKVEQQLLALRRAYRESGCE